MGKYRKRVTDALLTANLNPFRHYAPRGAAAQFIANSADEVLISGPAGTGKSLAALVKLNFCALHYPGSRHLIIRKTRASLTDTGLVTFERDVLGLDHPLVAGRQRAYRQSYQYGNGSEIVLGGMDKPGKVLSSEYDLIYFQQAEEGTEEDWETLTTRLGRSTRCDVQQLLGCCNPDRPTHWLKRRCDAGRTALLEGRHRDNPILWDNGRGDWTEMGRAYIARLDALTGARKQRLRHGRWVQAEGVVYEGWDPAVHLVDRFEVPKHWRKFCSVDFGYTHPFACLWWTVDPDGRLYLYRQLYHTQRTVKVHSEQIRRHSSGEIIETWVCDHDAEDMATLRENGIPTTPANKAVSVGIQKVQERLKLAGDGKPRLFIVRDSLVEADQSLVEAKKPYATEQEFDGYIWQTHASREAPVKADDHGLDSLRYAVQYLDGGPHYEASMERYI